MYINIHITYVKLHVVIQGLKTSILSIVPYLWIMLTYKHKTKDTGECFFVGLCMDPQKAYSRDGRDKAWSSVARRHGFEVEFIETPATMREFGELKDRLLNYKRRLSAETKAKMSAVRKGKPSHRKGKNLSDETRVKMSAARKRILRKNLDI